MKAASYTTAEVSRLSGASLRQLQWWAERQLLVPSMTRKGKTKRFYSVRDLEFARLVVLLKQKGFKRQAFRLAKEMPVRRGTWIGILAGREWSDRSWQSLGNAFMVATYCAKALGPVVVIDLDEIFER